MKRIEIPLSWHSRP